MHECKPNRDAPFHLIAKGIVEKKKRAMAPKAMAEGLGVSYLTFQRWLQGDKYHIHAEKLGDLCKMLGDFTLLDHLEQQAGRVAFVVPDIEETLPADDLIAVQRLVKEVGEALQSLASTLEDHVVEDWEVTKTIPELDDVIRECVRLKHWLKERSRSDRKKIKLSPKSDALRP
jgi:hypothetical protein